MPREHGSPSPPSQRKSSAEATSIRAPRGTPCLKEASLCRGTPGRKNGSTWAKVPLLAWHWRWRLRHSRLYTSTCSTTPARTPWAKSVGGFCAQASCHFCFSISQTNLIHACNKENKSNRVKQEIWAKWRFFLTWPDSIEDSAHVGVPAIGVVEAVIPLVGTRALGHGVGGLGRADHVPWERWRREVTSVQLSK